MKQRPKVAKVDRKEVGRKINPYTYFFFALIMIAAILAIIKTIERPQDAPASPSDAITGKAIVEKEAALPPEPIIAKTSAPKENLLAPAYAARTPVFYEQFNFSRAYEVNAIAIDDINRDGREDLIIGNTNARSYLFYNDGKGFYEDHDFGFTKTNALATGDLDGDGNIDIVFGLAEDNNYAYYNDGIGSFKKEALPIDTPGRNDVTSIAVADFDNDGRADIAVSQDNNKGNLLFLNQGNKKFIRSPQFGNERTQKILFADFDNDGWLDALAANYNQDSNIYYNRATKTARLFDEVALSNEVGNFIRAAALCDINQDGRIDIVTANYDQESAIYLNLGNRQFQKKDSFDRGNAVAIACADLNNDTWPDVVVGKYNEKSYVYLNNITNFVRSELAIPGSLSVIEAKDVNGDSYTDLVVGRYFGETEVWLNSLGKKKTIFG